MKYAPVVKHIYAGLISCLALVQAVLFFADTAYAATDQADDPDDFTIIMVGDILMHDGIEKCALQEDGSYDYSEIFRHTKKVIESADLALVNEEVIIGGEDLRITGYPSFNAPFGLADDLADAGFDVICHATNHALDRGKKGILNCIGNWADHPDIMVCGIHDSKEDSDNIRIFEGNGYKIAVLNYTYGTNGIPLPADMPYAVDLLDEKKVKDDLARAEKLADLTIVCPHWGTEYNLGISDMQKKWAGVFAKSGADIIIGTHPHVIEPIEEITTDGGKIVPVYYSIGNFINWTSGSGRGVANRMVGAMATVTLSRDKEGKAFVKEYGVRPVVSHVESRINGSTVYFLDDYTQAKAFLNEIRKRDPQFSLKYCEDLCEGIFAGYITE